MIVEQQQQLLTIKKYSSAASKALIFYAACELHTYLHIWAPCSVAFPHAINQLLGKLTSRRHKSAAKTICEICALPYRGWMPLLCASECMCVCDLLALADCAHARARLNYIYYLKAAADLSPSNAKCLLRVFQQNFACFFLLFTH